MRRRICPLFVMLSLFSLSVFSPSAFALSWNVHVVEAQPNPCWTTLAVGEWGTAVLYADGVSTGLRLAWGGPDSWEYESPAPAGVSGSWVRCCSLESGELFAVWYHTPQGHSLMTAQGRPGETWQIVSRDFLGELEKKRDMGLGLALDPSGNPWVAFVKVNAGTLKGILKLMFPTIPRSPKNIDYEDTTSSVGASCDITVDSSGRGHLAFFRTNNMSLRNRRWSLEAGRSGLSVINADIGISEGISLLEGDGGEVAAFFRSASGNLYRKIYSNDIWSPPVLLDAGANTGGFATSLRDSHGKTYVFYSGGTEGGARLLTDRTGEWKIHVVDPDSVLGSRCAATLSGDAVLVSYWDAFSRSVKLLRVGNTPPSTPSGPDPADGSEPEAAPDVLSWNACSDDENDGVTYSIYVSDARWKVEFLEEDARIVSGETVLSADLPVLLRDSSPVFWRVVAIDSYGSSCEGPIWSYEVLPPPTPTSEPEPSPTAIPTPAATSTPTPVIVPSATPTEVPSPTSTPTPIVSPGISPTPVLSPTASPTPAATHTPTPVIVPSATPTEAPSPTSTPTPIVSPGISPTPVLSPTASPTPVATHTPTPAIVPSATPTEVPSPTPGSGVTPTHAPTQGPGPTSNPEPSPSRLPTPTSFVPSPVEESAESNAGCDATGGSLVVLMLLAPLLLGPLDRK